MAPTTIVIVGAGLAGMSAAETLRSSGYDGKILLVGEEIHLPYNKPPLSKQVLKGEMTTDATAYRSAEWYADKEIELVLGSRATGLDTSAKRVSLADGSTLPYDALLLATGGRARTLDVEGVHLAGVNTLRTIEDARQIKSRLIPGAPIIVVGAGFIGAEVAACARDLGCEVTILEIADVPMNRVLGPTVGQIYTQLHRDHGVDVRCGVALDAIAGDDEVTHVFTSDGQQLDASAVVIGVGIVPEDGIATSTDVEIGNGVVVDEFCRTAAADVYAAGDVAYHPNPLLGRSFRVEQWQNAQHQGQAAARSMLGIGKPFAEVPWFWSDQYNVGLQMAGLPSPTDDVVFRGDTAGYAFSAFYLRDGVMEGVVGLNRVLDVRHGRTLIGQRAVVSANELSDESVDLAELTRRNTPTT